MSAGTGVLHSEFNPSPEDEVHFLQIWIVPAEQGIAPAYEQRGFEPEELHGALRLVASPDGVRGSVTIHQDASMYAGRLDRGSSVTHLLAPGRHAWIQVADGSITVNGTALEAGDGAAVSDETRLEMRAVEPSEVLLFDLA